MTPLFDVDVTAHELLHPGDGNGPLSTAVHALVQEWVGDQAERMTTARIGSVQGARTEDGSFQMTFTFRHSSSVEDALENPKSSPKSTYNYTNLWDFITALQSHRNETGGPILSADNPSKHELGFATTTEPQQTRHHLEGRSRTQQQRHKVEVRLPTLQPRHGPLDRRSLHPSRHRHATCP